MGTRGTGGAPRKRTESSRELIETCWRLRGLSGKTLDCVIYRTAAGTIEVRASYGPDELLSALAVGSMELAREHADDLRRLVMAKGNFEELR